MIYLKEFATESAYNEAKDGLLTPNVSLITETGEVKYLKGEPTPPTPTHEYVDLGLPSGTLWATMNLGASLITDAGLYYQWGDTQGYELNEREWEDYTYKWYNTETYEYTKYNHTDSKRVLDNSDDAAISSWGDGWHIPTKTQFQELINANYTTAVWTTNYQGSGANGVLITSKSNNNTLFLPENPDWEVVSYQTNTTFGQYPLDTAYYAFCDMYATSYMNAQVRDENTEYASYRCYATSIRPVKDA